MKALGYAVVAGALLASLAVAGPAAAAPSVEKVPFRMDASNQAAWWKPIDEWGGRVFVAYNAWGSPTASGTTDTNTVYIARRDPDGTWTRGCIKNAAGACIVYPDDVGHRNPTIVIDGDGFIHAFVGLHNNNWRYFRSTVAGDPTSMVDRSATMPDQGNDANPPPTGNKYTYPSATRFDNGDVYLIVRAFPAGRLYRWNNATDTWTRVATFANAADYVVYPDEVSAGGGDLHITWEWAYGGAGGLRHLGSYLRYSPATGQFRNAAGTVVAVPATTTSPVVYQPLEGTERATDTNADRQPGVQSAKVAVNSAGRPVIAYRYRSGLDFPFRVRLAEWTGSAWHREIVYGGAYDTYPAVDVSVNGSAVRVYYAKFETTGDNQAFAATRQPGGWAETLLLPGVPVERLSVIRRGSTDHLYLADPAGRDLYYGTNPW